MSMRDPNGVEPRPCCGPVLGVTFGMLPGLPGVMCLRCRKVAAGESMEDAVASWNAGVYVQEAFSPQPETSQEPA